ncbi:MAG: hypothetical protein DYG93_11220 [Leptolyngbya sp. PLA2]|nr:hypothetical protein [Leptolyngbya sp.]MCE7972214.1 hypothetical protein [Leptolyngbya sp. PL-A2]MCQ3941207.1 hypothetical protein [cyanobacterium CYA1]MDL1905491.1 hypothetical protein [Synechococcales cyanobacterium CNB]
MQIHKGLHPAHRTLIASLNGSPYNDADYYVRPECYWFRTALPDTGGATGTPGRLEFFNAANAPRVTNMPQASQLPSQYYFALQRVGIYIEAGRSLAGAAIATHQEYVEGTAVPTDSAGEAAEARRLLYAHGVVNMRVGNRRPIENVFGVHNFPWPSTPHIDGATHDTNTTVHRQFASTRVAHSTQDGYWFDPPTIILPLKRINLSIDWSELTLDTFADLVVRVGLFGQLCTVEKY